MKLRDFTTFEPLNELRRHMQADLGTFVPARNRDSLTVEEIETLSRRGIDIDLSEIRTLDDGTLAYKDRRVLLYIRDCTQYSKRALKMPRFHVADCITLDEMRRTHRYERYVVATRIDGSFELNVKTHGDTGYRHVTERLDVCQNCLTRLAWAGFHNTLTSPERVVHVRAFSIAQFFEKYGMSLVSVKPRYTADSAPLNEYPANFKEISDRLRAEAGYKCAKCRLDLSAPSDRRYLQTHHKNGVKSDNSRSNLMALCLGCHAQEPNHAQVRFSPQYASFVAKHGAVMPKNARDFVSNDGVVNRHVVGSAKQTVETKLRSLGLDVIDMRRTNGGSLWVIGGAELRDVLDPLIQDGWHFSFAPNGSRSTGHRASWYLRT
jgi:hypothetical protein